MALPILQKDVFLNEDNTKSFVHMLPRNHYKRIRSLTLSEASSWRRDPPSLALIHLEISVMQNLQSLSYSYPWLTKTSHNTAKLHDLCDLLKNLPPTAKYLELASICRYDDTCSTEDHVCVIIANILPQLRHLRLENTTVCPSLFTDPQRLCKELKVMKMQYHWSHVKSDCLTECDGLLTQRSPEAPIDMLVRAARSCFEKGKFPMINTLTFDSRKIRYGGLSGNLPEFDCLYKINIIDQTTTVYPLDTSGNTATPYRMKWMWLRGPCCQTQSEGDVIMTCDDLYHHIEGRTWRATKRRTRLPILMLRDLGLQYHLRRLQPVNRVSEENLPDASTKARWLLMREKESGQRLLEVQTTTGLTVPAFPRARNP